MKNHFILNIALVVTTALLLSSCKTARFAAYGELNIDNIEGDSKTYRQPGLASANDLIHVSYDIKGRNITITNNSDGIMYIDKAQSHIIDNKSYATPLFSNTVTTVSSTSTNGASLNLGPVAGALGIGGVAGSIASGINVGGANTHGTAVQQYEQQVIILPPHTSQKTEIPKASNLHSITGNTSYEYEYDSSNTPTKCDFYFKYSISKGDTITNHILHDRIYVSKVSYQHAITKEDAKTFLNKHPESYMRFNGSKMFDPKIADLGLYSFVLGPMVALPLLLISTDLAALVLYPSMIFAATSQLSYLLPLGYNTKQYFTPVSFYF